MKKKLMGLGISALAALIVLPIACSRKSAEPKPVRIGWQVAWATQGQLALCLQKTNVMELCGLKGTFKSFTYGAPLSEAALAGQLDVAFVGDQPAIGLLSHSPDWTIVARLMDFRVAIIVPPGSPIRTIGDLKGKTLAIPFGSSTHRTALQMLHKAGLDPSKDLRIVNMDIVEQSDVVNTAAGASWPGVDAFASWDHHIAIFEKKGFARILESGSATGVVMMSQSFIQQHPQELSSFLAAFKLAYFYYAQHQDEADRWFAATSNAKFDPTLLNAVSVIEPNLQARNVAGVDIAISPGHAALLQDAADFAFSQKLIKDSLAVRPRINSDGATGANAFSEKIVTLLRARE